MVIGWQLLNELLGDSQHLNERLDELRRSLNPTPVQLEVHLADSRELGIYAGTGISRAVAHANKASDRMLRGYFDTVNALPESQRESIKSASSRSGLLPAEESRRSLWVTIRYRLER
jgi:hypothetical protein